jgi:large-conductance mechanosensitive channel
MNSPAQYLHFGFILISLANLLVIALLIVVFMLAVALRRPEKQRLSALEAVPEPEEAGDRDLIEPEVHA